VAQADAAWALGIWWFGGFYANIGSGEAPG